jgi:cysteine synthase B
LPSGARALLDAIGRTPLIPLAPGGGPAAGCRLYAKLESVNPGGSIKDRPVANMFAGALRRGDLPPGRRLLDSSSGNAGISYSMLGAALGVPVTIVVPGNASQERLDRIAAQGAELITTDPIEGYDEALREAKRLAEQQPERYWYCNQYANQDNWLAHYIGTGGEILEQWATLEAPVPDLFVAGVGTGGTLTGVGRRLREAYPEIRIVSVVPELFPGIEGLKPLGHPGDIVPEILDQSLIDERIPVSIEQALATCHALVRQGLFVGPSSGAYVHAARNLAARGTHRCIVTVLSDTGERYNSTGMWRQR